MGMIKGMFGASKTAVTGAANKIEANFLHAGDNSLFLGTRSQRDRLVGGKNAVFDAHAQHQATKKQLKEMQQGVEEEFKANPRGLGTDDLAKWRTDELSAIKDMHNASREQMGSNLIGGASEMGGAAWGYVSGADRAGAGWGRAGAIATRVGTPLAGAMAVGTAARYATGGTMTKNRKGERDIAGIPMI